MPHEFLSTEWFAAVDALTPNPPAPPSALADLVLNFEVTGASGGNLQAHMAAGKLGPGARDDAAATVTFPLDLAKQVLLEGNGTAAMQGMMSGAMSVEGAVDKLMALQGAVPDADYVAYQQQIRELTA